jgi:hypothetical protein
MFFQFYDFKKFDTITHPINFFLWNFYLVYLLRAALYRPSLELRRVLYCSNAILSGIVTYECANTLECSWQCSTLAYMEHL